MLALSPIQPVVWPAPPRVRAAFTTRHGGVSVRSYESLNLGDHVEDEPKLVNENRKRVATAIGVTPRFLKQVHGTAVANLDERGVKDGYTADAAVVSSVGIACTVMVADCLPVLIANVQGTVVAAAHCGWRGMSGVGRQGVGVLEATMLAARSKAAALRAKQREADPWQNSSLRDEWIAWLGPAIGPQHYEVGSEVRDAFVSAAPEDARAFIRNKEGRFQANLFALARMRLNRLGIADIHGGGDCTYSQPDVYFSHRRATHQGLPTGRQAAMIWLEVE